MMHLCMYVCMYACMYDPAALQCLAADAHNGGWQAQPVSFAPGGPLQPCFQKRIPPEDKDHV